MPPPLISSLSWHALTLPRHVRPHLKIRERLVEEEAGRQGRRDSRQAGTAVKMISHGGADALERGGDDLNGSNAGIAYCLPPSRELDLLTDAATVTHIIEGNGTQQLALQ